MTSDRTTTCDICGKVAHGFKATEDWGWYSFSDKPDDQLDNDIDFCPKCVKLADAMMRSLVADSSTAMRIIAAESYE